MMVAGIDVGAATAKAVILSDESVTGSVVIPTGYDVSTAAESVIREALENSGRKIQELSFVVSTGYGRNAVALSNKAITEIICHACGVNWMVPEARTVIDIGGQDSKVIGIDDKGNVDNFVMNDKCAAGTGRFLEVMSKVLGIGIDNMGRISLQGTEPCSISSTCTVFAESEMVILRARGESRENIIAGIHKAMAHRVALMGRSVGFRKEVVFTGGVAKNEGMKKALEDELSLEILVPEEPQIMGALGAALLARAEAARRLD
ncbi:MAG: 2-hydroxyglutaryl-CoA dehydratase [Deltaproteobacteria bacterium]|nr:2-hydroxyglutaryl-CoA dehydratase [Deltaproteobacteria bacterium]MBW1977839.1 2-hydroxyglutaryl-CoA dehydratase [Deltaproteobacteria bacterium]MBW2044637.1 2-hydroxyglutaryl-CoA dehydratase [Deltaproteobacteria bacterium]MBW2298981.1 2-hydroxyglutaryl-CoA dehydratase [Deltaproteobacteria bacterium]